LLKLELLTTLPQICNIPKEVILLTLFSQLSTLYAYKSFSPVLFNQTHQILFKLRTLPTDIGFVSQIFWGGKPIGQKQIRTGEEKSFNVYHEETVAKLAGLTL